METAIILYDTRTSTPLTINVTQLESDLHFAIARFSHSERRFPAAIVISMQLARHLDIPLTPLLGNLYQAGFFATIPLIVREAYLDPLFQLI